MVSTTSGTTGFSQDVDDIIEEAMEAIGGDYTSGTEQAKARRTLNLLLIEMQNKKVPLSKISSVSIPLLASTSSYSIDNSVSDVFEVMLKNVSNNTEYSINREGRREFHQLPNKTQEGRPTTYTIDRQRDNVVINVWPVPKKSGEYTLELLSIKRIEDIDASYQKIDLPYRYYPLLVAWLSYKLSLKRQGIDENTRTRLKNELMEIMNDTFEEDRERTDMYVVIGGISGR